MSPLWDGPKFVPRVYGSRPRSWPVVGFSGKVSLPNRDAGSDLGPIPKETMMRFYQQQHRYYCGVDLHARSMFICILDQSGEVKAALGRPSRCVWCRFHAAAAMRDNPSAWTKPLRWWRLPKATKKSPASFEIPWCACLTFRAIDGFGRNYALGLLPPSQVAGSPRRPLTCLNP